VLGLQHNPDGSPKDTTHNMHASGEFVVYLVDEGIAEAIDVNGTDFPPGQGEPLALGIPTQPSTPTSCRRARCPRMSPHGEPRLRPAAGAPHRRSAGRAGAGRHCRPIAPNVDFAALAPVGRLCGASYARQRDRFELKRISYAEWRAGRQKAPG
jgi:hypothetical protein